MNKKAKELGMALKLIANVYQPKTRHDAIEFAVETADLLSIYLSATLLCIKCPTSAQNSIDRITEFVNDSVRARLREVEEIGGPKSPFTISEVNQRTRDEIMREYMEDAK